MGTNKVTINGVELDFDIFDYETASKTETALNEVFKKAEQAKKDADGIGLAQAVKQQCEAVFAFFDDIWGEGTADKLFGGSMNLMDCIDAFNATVGAINQQKAALEAKTSSLTPNRATRREKAGQK